MTHPKEILDKLFAAVIDAAMPYGKIEQYLPKEAPKGRTIILGAGKAAASMALEVERVYPYPLEGMVITRYGHGCDTRKIQVIEASHPVPDDKGEEAAKALYEYAKSATADDVVIFLASGGASALMSLPAKGIDLEDKKYITKQLLASGARIDEMNVVRKHLSAIKGGKLAQAAESAKVITIAISDVVGDDLSIIGSGATVPDLSTFDDAKRILKKYAITVPKGIQEYLDQATEAEETPKVLNNVEAHLIVTPHSAFTEVKKTAEKLGLNVLFLGDSITGEARHVASVHAGIAKYISQHDAPIAKPALLLSGGETTVTLNADQNGKGGRNLAFLLSLAIELEGFDNIYALACDTDGIDGSEDNAGAYFLPETIKESEKIGLSAQKYLEDNDSYTFFEQLNQLIITGPTRTNINDFRAILIL